MMKILCILACVLGILSPTVADSICNADLGLVVDVTESLKVATVAVMKEALEYLVQKFDISEDKTHVSLETFHKNAKIHNSFKDSRFWSVNDVIGLIDDEITTELKSGTFLDIALERANHGMFTEANGDRSGELSALVLFTDGKTSDNTDRDTIASSIEDLKNKGVIVIAVGIGEKSGSRYEANRKMLKQIAKEKVIYLDEYNSRDEAMDAVVNLVCVCKPNLGLVVDTTKSLRGNEHRDVSTVLNPLKKALADFVQKFNIAEDKTHVSLETFDGTATVHNKFNDPRYWSLPDIIKLINNTITKLTSPTRLDEALKEANRTMFTEASGYNSEELNALLVIADGGSKDDFDKDKFASYIKALEDKGVNLFAVGIGPDSQTEESKNNLEQIAGDVSYVPKFERDFKDEMENALNDVFDKICGLPRTGRISALT